MTKIEVYFKNGQPTFWFGPNARIKSFKVAQGAEIRLDPITDEKPRYAPEPVVVAPRVFR